MEPRVASRLLRLIGLGVRARNVVVGVEQVRTAARKGNLVLAVIAPDASTNSREKVVPLLRARRVMFVEGPTAAELGAAVGRVQTAAVGVVNPQLARGIRELVTAAIAKDSEEG